MLNSLTAKVAFVGGVGLTTAVTLGHSFFGWGGQSNKVENTDTVSKGSSQSGRARGEADSQSSSSPQEQVNKLKESNNCYSALTLNSQERLLACIDKNSGRNLAFYYYNPSKSPALSEKIVSLKAKKESGLKLTITLKSLNDESITLQNVSTNFDTPWFWSGWFDQTELQLNSLCRQSQIFTEHNSGRRPLTCKWELKDHHKSGTEVWRTFSLPSNLLKQ